MSTYDREAFEMRWGDLTVDQRTSILHDTLEILCIEAGLPVPDFNIAPPINQNDPYGSYNVERDETSFYPDTDNGNGAQINDPWESINTIGHEFSHYYADVNGLSYDPSGSEAAADVMGDQIEQEWRDKYEQHGNSGPEPNRLEY